MRFLLDTNVISEGVKPSPDRGVMRWLSRQEPAGLFISLISFSEIRYGIERLAAGKRKSFLDEWLRVGLPIQFAGRVLPIDAAVAEVWGVVVARCEAAGRRIDAMDAMIAATALVHGLTLATRDVTDFSSAVSDVVNPWIS